MALYVQNICVCSVRGGKKKRENFFTVEVPTLTPPTPTEMILAGDFNCIVNSMDSTGNNNCSRALQNLISQLDLHDAWTPTDEHHGYTYYGYRTASRLDRIYLMTELYKQKTAIEMLTPAFMDDHAIMLRINLQILSHTRGRGYWKMNILHLLEDMCLTDFMTQWAKWQTHKKYYPNDVLWWCWYVKPMITEFLYTQTPPAAEIKNNCCNADWA
jgi:hypothetical protein